MEYERMTPQDRRHADAGPSGAVPGKKLRGPVGIRHGKQVANFAADQRAVMDMLDNVTVDIGGNRKSDGSGFDVVWPLAVEGRCSIILWQMILRFQNFFYTMGGTVPPPGQLRSLPDGVVDPGGRTQQLLMLNRGDTPVFPADDVKEIAKAAIPQAQAWVQEASAYLLRYKVWRLANRAYAFDATAANTHLHLDRLSDADSIARIDEWRMNYTLIAAALYNANRVFVRATRDEALAARNVMSCWGVYVPAWALPYEHIWFGPDMLGLGPKCKAAILVHEAGHYIRPKIGHQGGEGGDLYDKQSADQALTSAYVCANFAVHAATGRDERYGLARPRE